MQWKSISQEKVETFVHLPEDTLVFAFSDTRMCDVILWTTILEKKGDKTSCNNRVKRTSFFYCLELMTALTNWGQMCCKSKSIKIHKQFGTAAQTYPRFIELLLCTCCLAPAASSPPWARSADRQNGWQLHITLPHGSAPHHFHYIVILNYQQRWTGKDEWHIPANRAATAWLQHVLASPTSCHARQERAGQVPGQGASLIPHKYGGIPCPPSVWEQYMCAKWRTIYLGRHVHHMDYL